MPNNPTIDAYNKYANLYDKEVVEFWENFPRKFLDQFMQHTSGKNILNVGSGSGRDALLLRDMGFEVVCQDGAQSMVDITTTLGFKSHLADFSDISFLSTTFDGIWAYTSLIHLPKAEAQSVMQNLRLMLEQSGTLALGVIEGQEAGMVERKSMPGVSRYFKNYTSQELKDMIEPLGFTLVYEDKYQPHHNVYLNQLYQTNT